MYFELRQLIEDKAQLEAAAQQYEEHGLFVLTGLEELVMPQFRPVLANAIGVDGTELSRILSPNNAGLVFPPEVRRRLAKCETTPELADSLLSNLAPLLTRFIGPLVHISSTFHGQFKGGQAESVGHGGYGGDSQYMEVHGAYLLHEDFTGATLPTSPSGLTMWVAMNDCDQWSMRFYPGSHRRGLLCNQWLDLDDPRAAPFGGESIDIPARVGSAIVFNAMMVHGTSNPGPKFRVSCDIRFFPLCGFLPSEVHALSDDPVAAVYASLERATGPVLRTPLLEDLVYLGRELPPLGDVPPFSVLNWIRYIEQRMHGESDAALPFLERFTNTEIGVDTPATYAARFHKYPLDMERLRTIRDRLSTMAVGAR